MTTNAVAKFDPSMVLPPGVDTAGMTEQEIQELAEWYRSEIATSKQGVELQPIRFKINKDACQFMDALGELHKELRGILVFKHVARGNWAKHLGWDQNMPACGSFDGKTGALAEGAAEVLDIADGQACVTCPYNAWGSGVDEQGNPTRGKLCKEMRRLFLMLDGAQMPIMLTLPPSSIGEFDRYISARVQQAIADIAAETVITLRKETGGRFTYAVAEFSKGAVIPPQRMLQLAKMRGDLQAVAEKAGLDLHDDYGVDEGAPAGGGSTAGDSDPF